MKIYEAVATALLSEGTGPVYALMGDGNMELLSAVDEQAPERIVHVRHENAAVAMADGWARASGEVGVCTVTSGPGLTQIATSLVVAARQGTPIVVLAGDAPWLGQHNLQEFAQEPFATASESGYVRIRSGDTALDDVRTAFVRARAERRPVVLGMPVDVGQDDLEWDFEYEPARRTAAPVPAFAPQPEELQELAGMLMSCERVVVLAGRGAVAAGARDALVTLADRLGARLASTLRAKGFFDGEDWDLGVAGAFSSSQARALFAEADAVIAFGAGLGYYTTEGGYLFPAATVVQVDTRPRPVVEGQRPAHVQIAGDARLVAEHLVTLIEGGTPSAKFRSEGPLPPAGADAPVAPTGGLDPAVVLTAVDRAVPTSASVVIGAGHFWNFAVPAFTRRPPERYVFTYDFGCIGQGLPVGMGVARYAGPTVVVEGDGSVLMNVQELETLRRHPVPLLCLVMNDGAYGAEVHKLRAKGLRGEQVDFGRTDLTAVATSLGLRARTVDSVDRIAPIVEEFFTAGAPTLVDVHISPEVIAPTYRRLFYGVAD